MNDELNGLKSTATGVADADVTDAATDLRTLIDTLCPDGVEWKALGECSKMQRGTMLTQKDVVVGDVPVISGGVKPAYYHNTPNRTGETITVASSGASSGYVQYWNQPIYVNDAFSVKGIPNLTDTKFLYYYLKNIQPAICATKIGGGVPHVRIDGIKNFRIPVPPLAVQAKIVQILDKFTELAKELAKEKQARRTQYEYYRDWLLDLAHPEGKQGKVWDLLHTLCPDGVEWKMLGDIGKFYGGLTGKCKQDFVDGNAQFITYKNVYNNPATDLNEQNYVHISETEKQHKLEYGDIIFTGSSENTFDCAMSSVIVKKPTRPVYLNSFCFIFRLDNPSILLPEFSKYIFRCQQVRKQLVKTVNGVTRFNVSKVLIGKVTIPVPPLPVQAEIVRILDQFSTLAEDITAGLPAEIAARQTQYEYYRNQLLSFKDVSDRAPGC